MKTLRFDSVGGASGDMILASLTGLGVDTDSILTALSSLEIGDFAFRTESVSDYGLQGLRLHVDVQDHGHSHAHRHLGDIRRLIDASSLPAATKGLSIRVFERLARAEAAVHGTTPDQIHFHEVGAVDSIVDIVGSCFALERLDVRQVIVGPLPDGQGTTRFSHGVMPIPVPAVVELLKGRPVVQTDEPFEMVTPTAAALLTTWQDALAGEDAAAGRAPAVVLRAANAFGHRKLNTRPNLLRAILLETAASEAPQQDECLVLECNLDDVTSEIIGSMTQTLLARGALDVFTPAVQMKTIFAESTTFGIREYATRRTILGRRHVEVLTRYGKVRVKIGAWKGCEITKSPEHADCAACAEASGVPLRVVYDEAIRAVP